MIGGACGVIVTRYMDRLGREGAGPSGKIGSFILLLFFLYAAMLLQIIIHEAGHLVFGLLTGYRFSSFRIFNYMLLKENGKLKVRHLSLSGTGGQCLMAPPDPKNGRMPVLLYNFGGAILNLVSSALFFALSKVTAGFAWLSAFLLILSLVGVAFALVNGLPLRLGPVDNDGCNALSMIKSREAAKAFWIQMKINEETSKGVRLKDMPGEWLAVPDEEAMKNSIHATIGVMACSRLMDEHRFEDAKQLMGQLMSMESGIVELYRRLMTCDRIYVELVGEKRQDVVNGFLTKEQKKLMKAMKNFPQVLRTEYALALFFEDGERQENILKQFEKSSASYPYPVDIQGERELIEIARERFQKI